MIELDSIKVATWNVEWASSAGPRGQYIVRILLELDCDLICLTEYQMGCLPNGSANAHPDYGYPHNGNRRKVGLWSRFPLQDVRIDGPPGMPPGRYVEARASTTIGDVVVIGVCVPWRAAHVTTGRRNAKLWEEHLRFLTALAHRLEGAPTPIILLGDFNQTIPRSRQPVEVFEALRDATAGLNFLSRGLSWQGTAGIDHIAVTPDLAARNVAPIPKLDRRGAVLSDHFGLVAEIERAA